MSSQQAHFSNPKYRPDIDGLRAIAVLSVVGFHAFPEWVKGGFIGVDIFFVISGYLISTIIFENLEYGTFSFSEFYVRRIRRIFPALLLVLISTYAFGWIALLGDEFKQLGGHIVAGAGFVSNLVLWNEAGYFDNSAATKPLLHLWSLGIEEQFYIVWPLLLWLAWKMKFDLFKTTIAIAGISFFLNVIGISVDATATFYSPQTRFWELLCGSILAWVTLYKDQFVQPSKAIFAPFERVANRWLGIGVVRQFHKSDGKPLPTVLSIAGVSMLACGLYGFTEDLAFPGMWALIPVLGAVFVISAGPNAWLNRVVLSNRVAVWFGLISFPLYLWHWPLLSFARIIESQVPSASIRISAVLLSIVMAWVTYRLVERPIRFGEYGKLKTVTLLLLMALTAYVGYGTYSSDGEAYRSAAMKQSSVINAQFVGPLWKYATNEICQNEYPLKESARDGWWFCMKSSTEKPTLLLLGNSYANQHYPGVIHNRNLQQHVVLSIGTCGAEWVERSELNGDSNRSPCSGFRPADQMELINTIVTTEHSIRYALIDGLSSEPDAQYIKKLKKRIDFLEVNNVRVVLFVPHVKIDYDIKGCFARPLFSPKKTCDIPLDLYKTTLNKFNALADSLRITNPSVLIFDQNLTFCDDQKCSFKINGMPAFRDEYAHLSEYASDQLMIHFVDWARISAPDLISN